MTFAAVGSSFGGNPGATTFSLTPNTIGDLILVEVASPGGTTVIPTSLSSSNVTWTTFGTSFSGTTNIRTAQVFAGKVTSTSTATVTVTWSGTAPASILYAGQEFSSTAGAWALDVQGHIDSSGTNTWASLTPAAAGELYFGYARNAVNAIAGSTSGYTYIINADTQDNGMAYNPACTSSAQVPVWGDSTQNFGIMVLVKETGSTPNVVHETGYYYTGRIGANYGAPVHNPQSGPKFFPRPYPVQAQDPYKSSYPGGRAFAGRVYGISQGAPVHNPQPGPKLFPRNWPVQAQDPYKSPYPGARAFAGRIYGISNAGGPVLNPAPAVTSLNQAVVKAGSAWSVSFGGDVGTSDTLFAVVTGYNNTNVTITSSAPTFNGSAVTGATKILEKLYPFDGNITDYVAVWMFPPPSGGWAASAGPIAVTVTNSLAIPNVGIIAFDIAGLGTSPTVDQLITADGDTTSPSSGTTGAIQFLNEFVLGVMVQDQTMGTQPSGWTNTLLNPTEDNSLAGYQLPAGSGGTYAYSATVSPSARWAAGVVTVYNPAASGPAALYPARQAVRARLPQPHPPAGRAAGGGGVPAQNPSAGPAVHLLRHPVRSPVPRNSPRGRTASSSGAPVRNPQPGPEFTQATSPIRARIPRVYSKGRIGSNPGTVVPPPLVAGPPFYPIRFPARARIPQNAPRGRVYSNKGAPVHNPQPGPFFRQATAPVQARHPLPPRGGVSSNPGVLQPVVIGPVFRQATEPIRARIPQTWSKGRISSNPGTLPQPLPVWIPWHGPVRIHPVQPPRGRIWSNQGTPVFPPGIGPRVYPQKGPVRVHPVLPPRGRTAFNKGALVRNPQSSPVFRQAVKPIRGIIPQNAPRGRIGSNSGGPVENIPNITLIFTYGDPEFGWTFGAPEFEWAYNNPEFQWVLGPAEL